MGFFTTLQSRAEAINSLLCVGLDPHAKDAPTAKDAEEFCLNIIQATKDLAVAYKPNAAFFEAHGVAGMEALGHVIAAIPRDIPIVLDAKRGDISTTAQAYKQAADALGVQCITLAPYMGRDSIDPFIQDTHKGCFVLCKTSNPSAKDFQTLACSTGRLLYQEVALLASTWNTKDNVGLVVGATDPQVHRVHPPSRSLGPQAGASRGSRHVDSGPWHWCPGRQFTRNGANGSE